MSLIRKHGAVLQAWACLALVLHPIATWPASYYQLRTVCDSELGILLDLKLLLVY